MNLIPIVKEITARCFNCGQRVTMPQDKIFVDADRPAYVETYYCSDCTAKLNPVQPLPHRDPTASEILRFYYPDSERSDELYDRAVDLDIVENGKTDL